MAKLTKDQIAKKIQGYLACRDRGKKGYAAADVILEEIQASLKVGQKIPLPGGRSAELVDNFAEKTKVYKMAGVSRFDLKISNE